MCVCVGEMFANAIRLFTANAAEISTPHSKPPPFSVGQYHPIEDYFNRFDWALQLRKIPEEQYASYARLYMEAELNNALKFLVSPRLFEQLPYNVLRKTLISHFDHAESIKFRRIAQQKEETIVNFALRLKQGAAHYEYGDLLDKMLI